MFRKKRDLNFPTYPGDRQMKTDRVCFFLSHESLQGKEEKTKISSHLPASVFYLFNCMQKTRWKTFSSCMHGMLFLTNDLSFRERRTWRHKRISLRKKKETKRNTNKTVKILNFVTRVVNEGRKYQREKWTFSRVCKLNNVLNAGRSLLWCFKKKYAWKNLFSLQGRFNHAHDQERKS